MRLPLPLLVLRRCAEDKEDVRREVQIMHHLKVGCWCCPAASDRCCALRRPRTGRVVHAQSNPALLAAAFACPPPTQLPFSSMLPPAHQPVYQPAATSQPASQPAYPSTPLPALLTLQGPEARELPAREQVRQRIHQVHRLWAVRLLQARPEVQGGGGLRWAGARAGGRAGGRLGRVVEGLGWACLAVDAACQGMAPMACS